METKNDFAKKRALFSVALVLLSVVVLLIIFLVNKDKIFTNLKETNFFEKIFGSTPAIIENHQIKRDENEEMPLRENFAVNEVEDFAFPGLKSDAVGSNGEVINNGVNDNINNNEGSGVYAGEFGVPGTFGDEAVNGEISTSSNFISNGAAIGDLNTGIINNGENIEADASSGAIVNSNNIAANSSASAVGETSTGIVREPIVNTENNVITKDVAPKTAVATSSFELCFVMIDGDGAVLRKMIKRTAPKSDSPLTTAINLLLEGPDVRNKHEAECRSLIPEGSKLLSARVSDGVAYLNFNEDFEFNPFGVEGAIHQLEQVVYTATAFSTVNSVQFLIEGQKREYLGSEGQWIGTPLSRANF